MGYLAPGEIFDNMLLLCVLLYILKEFWIQIIPILT